MDTRQGIAIDIFRDFLNEAKKLPEEGTRRYRHWTKRWLGVLEKVGQKHKFIVKREKPVRIDMSWYSRGYYDPVAAIEVETYEDTIWNSEMVNLLYSSARLKVMLTYISQDRLNEFLSRMSEFLVKRRAVPTGEEFLAIFIVYHREGGSDAFDEWRGYLINTSSSEGKIKASTPVFLGEQTIV